MRAMNADAMFPLDDEDIMTDLEQEPWTGGSFIGPLPEAPLLNETLTKAVECLERTCEAFDSVDPSAEAAELSLRRRVGALSLLTSALGNVYAFAGSPTHRELFVRDTGLLEPYTSNVTMWASDVAETLVHLARELNTLAPNWAAFRECMSNVEWIHARAASEQTRLERVADTLPDDLRAAVDELEFALARFKLMIDEPFG
jgi:hypothetical protein